MIDVNNINWNAVSAIGSWFGGIATFLAVCVALWDTRLKTKKSLILTLNQGIYFDGFGNNAETINFTFMNNGNRDIEIQEFGVALRDGSALTILSNAFIGNSSKLPILLEPDLTAEYYILRTAFAGSIKKAVSTGTLKDNDNIVIFVRDNFSKRYYQKTTFKVRYLL